ncbi:apolipoprotein N-acyltransferase [Owenweeksia hongkongensis DSM 17368]|uniref:Apolipoprotein N-acyltransferase n=1 Tax=Owenweeksia hongkongensis (strain DSM 17368 / CIP 108786 / JCM 12287 / NRRL B-23963 / UST20020801) TaxID=926562 RepID=G8QZY4_OWEHD|nr:apolipoprotein N-acyltransferase [Owenweeksia hongkongensis]AEV32624.1 apolipoprotein N-acyltransferase [Owenweeksia hongkongensis DSM 17368]
MFQRILYAILTSLLLWVAWPPNNITPLLFIAFIPILLLERNLSLSGEGGTGKKIFLYSWLAFGLWNIFTTWWLINAHWSGLLMTTLVNGALMALVITIFHFIKRKLGNQRGYIALPFLWICLEILHKNWDLSFPWLNLGNGFTENVEWIQWYEYTGAFGGTFWIWLVNLLLFSALTAFQKSKNWSSLALRLVLTIIPAVLVPIQLSHLRYSNYEEQGEEANIVVVQPSIDTYTEKNIMSNEEQAVKFLRLGNFEMDSTVDFLVGPEDLLTEGTYIDKLEETSPLKLYKAVVGQYPNLNIVSGATLLQHYSTTPTSPTAREYNNTEAWYDVYNSAIMINRYDSIPYYHKSKLVPGVEMMPFSSVLKPVLGNLISSMGGTSNGLGYQKSREVFTSADGQFKVAPLICWESDFGEYVTEYIRKGANLLFIITNDDWWDESPGYIQHLHYARLRAIENRRSIARSANTGVSCFINQRGDIIQPQPYKKPVAIKGVIKANTELTYYSKAGDVLGRVSLFISGFMLLFAFVKGYLKKVNSLAQR